MIQVHILRCKDDIQFRGWKNATFLQGEYYFGRMSKNGDCYVVRSEEGYWIPIEQFRLSIRVRVKEHYFATHTWVLMKNRKELNSILSVDEVVPT